jgi:hypothetical protein
MKKNPIAPKVTSALNRKVSPPVMIHRHLVFSFGQYSYNTYERGKQPVSSVDLSARERGHIYRASFSGDTVVVTNEFRIADEETATMLLGLRSLRNRDERLQQRFFKDKYGAVDTPKALQYAFSLSKEDYDVFKERVIDTGGQVLDGLVGSSDLLDGREAVQDLARSAAAYLKTGNDLLGTDDTDRTDRALLAHERALAAIEEAARGVEDLASSCELSKREPGKPPEERATIISTEMFCAGMKTQLKQLFVEAKRFMSFIKKTAMAPDAPPIGTLEAELERLGKYYPVIRKIVAKSNDELIISVLEADIHYSGDHVEVLGNLTGLIRASKGGVTISRPDEEDLDDFDDGRFLQDL